MLDGDATDISTPEGDVRVIESKLPDKVIDDTEIRVSIPDCKKISSEVSRN
jgi:hypothetical protein